jgi:hypothetical protein
VREAKDAAEARVDAAEADAASARAAQAEAAAGRDDALAAARQLRSQKEVLELALQRTQADVEARSATLDELQVRRPLWPVASVSFTHL